MDAAWVTYWNKNKQYIKPWIKLFANPMYSQINKTDTAQQYDNLPKLLQQAWNIAPDSPNIHTLGFYKLCDLLDGGYLN